MRGTVWPHSFVGWPHAGVARIPVRSCWRVRIGVIDSLRMCLLCMVMALWAIVQVHLPSHRFMLAGISHTCTLRMTCVVAATALHAFLRCRPFQLATLLLLLQAFEPLEIVSQSAPPPTLPLRAVHPTANHIVSFHTHSSHDPIP